ncbi:hypothetical protein [Rhodobacteraceae bacterium DSL-40]|uniref:hypothetical protein n=1 Tax=Amaricoccus sp. B4 TaxID=3368557 RepID=UPI0013A6ED66
MSMWLSAMNKAAGPARGAVSAEMQRQQKAWMRDMQKAAGLSATPGKKASAKRRGKRG